MVNSGLELPRPTGARPSERNHRTAGRLGAVLLALGVGAYSVYDSFFLQAASLDIPIYIAVYSWTVLVTVVVFVSRPAGIRLLCAAGLLVFAFSLTLVRVPAQNAVIPRYILGDIAAYSLIGVFLVAAAALWRNRVFTRHAHWMVGLGLLGSLLAPLGPRVLGRFESPTITTIALLAALIMLLDGPKRLLIITSAGAALLLLCLASGNRTSVGLVLVAVVIGIYCRHGLTRLTAIAGILLLATGLLISQGVDPVHAANKQGFLGETRFGQLLVSPEDVSRQNRLLEAADALSEIKEGGVLALGLGFGPGASYVPQRSLIWRNLTEAGTVHHIHIGVVMLMYRYGLIGLSAFVFLIVLGIRAVRYSKRNAKSLSVSEAAVMFSVPLYTLETLVFNSTVQPAFAYVVAGSMLILMATKRHRRQVYRPIVGPILPVAKRQRRN